MIVLTIFFKLISQYDIKPYPESNSGFNECILDIKFIYGKNKKITPIIHKVFNWYGVKTNNIIDDHFVKDYYHWIKDCIILPHFGLSLHKKSITPNYGILSKYIQYSPAIKYSILEKIYLEFMHIDITHIEINVIMNGALIGKIKLHIKQNEIYIISIDITLDSISLNHFEINISLNHFEINVIFMLMDTLRAYYAPIQMSLLLPYEKKNDNIAFELEFAKKENYYIHIC